MSYLMSNLIMDILPRVGKADMVAGITIYQAANSVQSLISSRLLDKKSDLLAQWDLSLTIPANGSQASLPEGFISMSERPTSKEIYSDWMMGSVTSYVSTTGALVVNVTQISDTVTGAIASWNISTVPPPGGEAESLGTSVTSLTAAIGSKSLTATEGMDLSAGDPVYILPTDVSGITAKKATLQPNYLSEDWDKNDSEWWAWYGLYGLSIWPPAQRPKFYKIINTTFYVKPFVILPVLITGKYFGTPPALTGPTSEIPWKGIFDEVFRAGTVRILQKGIEIPELDQDFAAFIYREVDIKVVSRSRILPENRTHRSNYM